MLANLKFCSPAIVLLAGLSTSPGYSSPVTDPFNLNAGSQQAAAPVAPRDVCVPRPDKSPPAGQRWVYHRHGHRKCWFQAAEQLALKKRIQYRPAKVGVRATQNESAQRKHEAFEDVRAELPIIKPTEAKRSAAEPETIGAAKLPE